MQITAKNRKILLSGVSTIAIAVIFVLTCISIVVYAVLAVPEDEYNIMFAYSLETELSDGSIVYDDVKARVDLKNDGTNMTGNVALFSTDGSSASCIAQSEFTANSYGWAVLDFSDCDFESEKEYYYMVLRDGEVPSDASASMNGEKLSISLDDGSTQLLSKAEFICDESVPDIEIRVSYVEGQRSFITKEGNERILNINEYAQTLILENDDTLGVEKILYCYDNNKFSNAGYKNEDFDLLSRNNDGNFSIEKIENRNSTGKINIFFKAIDYFGRERSVYGVSIDNVYSPETIKNFNNFNLDVKTVNDVFDIMEIDGYSAAVKFDIPVNGIKAPLSMLGAWSDEEGAVLWADTGGANYRINSYMKDVPGERNKMRVELYLEIGEGTYFNQTVPIYFNGIELTKFSISLDMRAMNLIMEDKLNSENMAVSANGVIEYWIAIENAGVDTNVIGVVENDETIDVKIQEYTGEKTINKISSLFSEELSEDARFYKISVLIGNAADGQMKRKLTSKIIINAVDSAKYGSNKRIRAVTKSQLLSNFEYSFVRTENEAETNSKTHAFTAQVGSASSYDEFSFGNTLYTDETLTNVCSDKLSVEILQSSYKNSKHNISAVVKIEDGNTFSGAGYVELLVRNDNSDELIRTGICIYIDDILLDGIAPEISGDISAAAFRNGNVVETSSVRKGDVIKVSFALKDEESGIDNDSVKLVFNNNGVEVAAVYNHESGIYTAELVIGEDAEFFNLLESNDGMPIVIWDMKFSDNAGNEVSKKNSSDVASKIGGLYYTYMCGIENSIIAFDITGSEQRNVVKNADTFHVVLYTTHKLDADTANIKISGCSETSVSWITINNYGKTYFKNIISGQISSALISDGEAVDFSLMMSDAAENRIAITPSLIRSIDDKLSAITIDNMQIANSYSDVIYFAPIESSLVSAEFFSDNVKGGKNLAKDGDTITLKLVFRHAVRPASVNIAGQNIQLSDLSDKKEWIFTCVMPNGAVADNSAVGFAFEFTDSADNHYSHSFGQKNDAVGAMLKDIIYYAPLSGNMQLSFTTENRSGNSVKNGDNIKLSLEASHPYDVTALSIGNEKMNVQSSVQNGAKWNVSYNYSVSEKTAADNSSFGYKVEVSDAAGNTAVFADGSVMTYYSSIELKSIQLRSNNTENPLMYVKNGERVTLSFSVNHGVSVSSAVMNGTAVLCSYSAETGLWNMFYDVNGNMNDMDTVTFGLTLHDSAGNSVSVSNRSNGVNEIRYFAPLQIETIISASGSNPLYVKNGDTITVTAHANHNAYISSAFISGKKASVGGENTASPNMSVTISEYENAIKEGTVELSYTVRDAAGNTVSYIKESTNSIVYDNTKPKISMLPRYSGFSNEEVEFTVNFSDGNLNAQTISVLVNGEEQITKEDREKISVYATEYEKKFTVGKDTDEGEFVITAKMSDRAGNAALGENKSVIIIDKSAPKFRFKSDDIANVDDDGNITLKARIFNSNVNLLDYFIIEENNINEILCTLTDDTGVNEWSLDKVITGEGKKTVYIRVTDKAQNKSPAITYEFYIDSTAPKPVVKEIGTGKMITETAGDGFISQMSLNIALENIEVGDESRDYFTKLVLKCPDESEIDLLDGENELFEKDYVISAADGFSEGIYTIIAKASDCIGNESDEFTYSFRFGDKKLLEKYFENKPLLYSTLAVAAVTIAVLAAGTAFIGKHKRKA